MRSQLRTFYGTFFVISLLNGALSSSAVAMPVNLQFPFTQGEFWRVQSYEGHAPGGPQYAVDFWWASPQRADTYFRDLDPKAGLGKTVRAAHNGRVFIYAIEITNIGLTGNSETIRYDSETDTISPQIPKATFVLEADKDGDQRVIDLELVIFNESNSMLTLYVHSKIDDRFFTGDVPNKIGEVVRKFYNKTTPVPVAVDTNQDVDAYKPIGSVDQYGHASGPHLHFQVYHETSFSKSNPSLSNRVPLNNRDILLMDGDVVLNESMKSTYRDSENRIIYDYPAMPRNYFSLADVVSVSNPLESSVNVRSTPGGGVILGEVSNGTEGQILSDFEKMNIEGHDCVDTPHTCYVWWKIQFPSLTGWVVSPYLILVDNDSYPCHIYQSGASAFAPYGLAWDWTTSEQELLLKATCQTDSTTVDVGNGRETGSGSNLAGLTYVYHQGYHNTGSGSWTPFTLNCSGNDQTKVSNAWCKGSASASIPVEARWFVGYTCIWTGSRWQCGCTDTSCTTRFWQVQGIER